MDTLSKLTYKYGQSVGIFLPFIRRLFFTSSIPAFPVRVIHFYLTAVPGFIIEAATQRNDSRRRTKYDFAPLGFGCTPLTLYTRRYLFLDKT